MLESTTAQFSHSDASVAVIGAGICGLAAAHRLTELLPNVRVQLFEASDRIGGVLKTIRDGDYLVEASADNFITRTPWAKDLCQRVGLELLPTEPSLRRALVVRDGHVVPVPESFVLMSAGRWWPIVKSPVLSPRGKLRLAMEPFITQRSSETDESISSFARRRLGREVFERLVQPLVAGIYTADPQKLSMNATLPQFVEQEQQFGSLWKARNAVQPMSGDSGAAYSTFVAPREGMGQLIKALADRLPEGAVRLQAPVKAVSASSTGWYVEIAEGGGEEFCGVVLALPAPKSADCVAAFDGKLAAMLHEIQYAGVSIVAMGVRRDQIKLPISGFGFVVPQIEGRQIIA
ncbi:MAG: protoporphyrinogen oxidase, partial [Aeoliella sp.]